MSEHKIADQPKSLYVGSLDGLRCMAFFLVLVHHMPRFDFSTTLLMVRERGWAGVELFFVISSFLFFYLLNAENQKVGKVSYAGFYIRRMLRIYPLMIAFPLSMVAIYGVSDQYSLPRLAGIAVFSDNFIAWIRGYNVSIPYTAHLWTLSFEFQIYLVIPILFSLYVATGRKTFTLMICSFWLFCVVLRTVFFALDAPHPIIWVTPFLRPDSIIVGILLSIYRPGWDWKISSAITVAGVMAFLLITNPWTSPAANILQYPLLALTFAALVDASLKASPLARALQFRPLTYLGRISFGLYVFHTLSIETAQSLTEQLRLSNGLMFTAQFCIALTMSILLATASFYLFERPFLALKRRASKVDGRAKIKRLQLDQGL